MSVSGRDPSTGGSHHRHQHTGVISEGQRSNALIATSACPGCVQALTVEEAKERRERMAKMRSLLFAHEQKSKRLKAIKSKGFHRHAKKAAKMKVCTWFNHV